MMSRQKGGAILMALMLAFGLAVLGSSLVYLVRMSALYNHALDRVIDVRTDLQLSLNHWVDDSVSNDTIYFQPYEQIYNDVIVNGLMTGYSRHAMSARLFSARSLQQFDLAMSAHRGGKVLEKLRAFYSYPKPMPSDIDGRYFLHIPYVNAEQLQPLQYDIATPYLTNQLLGYFNLDANQLYYYIDAKVFSLTLPTALTHPQMTIGWVLNNSEWSFVISIWDQHHWYVSDLIGLQAWLASDMSLSLIHFESKESIIADKSVISTSWYPHNLQLLPMVLYRNNDNSVSMTIVEGEYVSTEHLHHSYNLIEWVGIDRESNLDIQQGLLLAKRTDNSTLDIYRTQYISGDNGLSITTIEPSISCNLNNANAVDIIQYAPDVYRILLGCQNQLKVIEYDTTDIAHPSLAELSSQSLNGNVKVIQAYGAFSLVVTHDNRLYLVSSVSGDIIFEVAINSHQNAQMVFSPQGLWLQSGSADCRQNPSVQNCKELPMALLNYGVIGLVLE